MSAQYEKIHNLEACLAALGSVAVAFSAGVDSAFLLHTAHRVLGKCVLAVTVRSRSFPQRELNAAADFCRSRGIAHITVDLDELSIDGFSRNPPNRCYLCKRELFTKILSSAADRGIFHVAEGSNADDDGDYRPGFQAIKELGIMSPLRDAGLTKDEIRQLSAEAGLPTWDKQSFACLATRFVYGEEITAEKLAMVDRAEQFLLDRGFHRVRVRVHGRLARIETAPEEFAEMVRPDTARETEEYLRSLGFMYVSLDLGGYKTGSMNREILKK